MSWMWVEEILSMLSTKNKEITTKNDILKKGAEE